MLRESFAEDPGGLGRSLGDLDVKEGFVCRGGVTVLHVKVAGMRNGTRVNAAGMRNRSTRVTPLLSGLCSLQSGGCCTISLRPSQTPGHRWAKQMRVLTPFTDEASEAQRGPRPADTQ